MAAQKKKPSAKKKAVVKKKAKPEPKPKQLKWHQSLKDLGACRHAREFASRYKSARAAWRACEKLNWRSWFLYQISLYHPAKDRMAYLFAATLSDVLDEINDSAENEGNSARVSINEIHKLLKMFPINDKTLAEAAKEKMRKLAVSEPLFPDPVPGEDY